MDNYKKDIQRNEYWYDEQGRLIHYKNNDGYEEWFEYNKQGKVIHYKNIDWYEEWHEYNEQGRLIHYLNNDEFEYWQEYDGLGNLIHYKNNNGHEEWYGVNKKLLDAVKLAIDELRGWNPDSEAANKLQKILNL